LTAVSLLHIGTDGFGGSREIAKRNSCPILKRKRFEMHTLYILMLGVVLGAGLVLAFQELRRQYTAFKERQWHRRASEAIALLNECTCWDTNGAHAYYCELANKPEPKRFRPIQHP
jgi:hypothetical protein